MHDRVFVQTAARVWDSLLAEGAKVLYRVSLALLKLYEADLLAMDNAGDLINHLRHCTQKIHDRDRLMKVGQPLYGAGQDGVASFLMF